MLMLAKNNWNGYPGGFRFSTFIYYHFKFCRLAAEAHILKNMFCIWDFFGWNLEPFPNTSPQLCAPIIGPSGYLYAILWGCHPSIFWYLAISFFRNAELRDFAESCDFITSARAELFNNAMYLDHDAATLQTAWKTYYLLTPSKHFQAEAWLSENCESCKVTFLPSSQNQKQDSFYQTHPTTESF